MYVHIRMHVNMHAFMYEWRERGGGGGGVLTSRLLIWRQKRAATYPDKNATQNDVSE